MKKNYMKKSISATNNDSLDLLTKDSKKHNGIISFWKFCFCMMIVIYHTCVFSKNPNNVILSKGSIGVEFFFIVSGYLMTKSALKKNSNSDNSNYSLAKDTVRFIWNKWKTFFPYTLLAGLISLTIINIYSGFRFWNNVTFIWDVVLLGMAGFKGLSVNGPSWYLQAMLLSMMILYPLIKKYKYNFLYIFAPIIVIFGLGFLNSQYGSLRAPKDWVIFTFKGNIRAFLELLLGGLLFILCEKMKSIKFTTFGKFCLMLVELVCFISPFLISHFIHFATKYDYVVLLMLSIGVVIAFSEKSLEYKLFCNKFCYWLERLSLTLYLFHFPVRLFIRNAPFFDSMGYMRKSAYYLFATMIVGIIIMYLMDYLKKHHFFTHKIKKLILN